MICRACGQPGDGLVCRPCEQTLRPAGERRLGCGLLVCSAYAHEGAARVLVHNLKYRGLLGAAAALAPGMAGVLPAGARCLVPVPRVAARLWRYGVDPAAALAAALARVSGLPMVPALGRPLWWAGRAGPAGAARGRPAFRGRAAVPEGAVLVDDVVTTGATLAAAAAALPGVGRAVTATSSVPAR